jgi:AraC-like DNA-binding protein
MTPGLLVETRRYVGPLDSHSHPYFQLVLPFEGRKEVEVEGRCDWLAPGRAMLVGERRRHASHAEGIQTAVVLNLSGADAGLSLAPLLEHWARLRFFPVDAEMMALVRYADRAFGAASGGDASGEARAWAELALWRLFRGLDDVGPAPAGARVARAMAFARTRLARPPGVAEMAAAAALSESAFHDAFRRATGQSPSAWLRALRLEKAADLLRETGLPIAEIALRTGFSDQAALTRAMKRKTGRTPGALRRDIRR